MIKRIFIFISVITVAIVLVSCAHAPSGSPASALVRQGIALFNEGKIDESASFFRQGYAIDPLYAPAYAMLGRVYLSKNDGYRAEMFFRKALALDPKMTELYGYLGDIYFASGDTAKGFEYYAKCPKEDPHYAILYYKLGMKSLEDGKSQLAREEFEKALSSRSFWGAHFGLGLLAYFDRDYENAILHLKKAQCDSADKRVYFYLGKSLSALGRNAEAYIFFKRYSRFSEANPDMKSEAESLSKSLADSLSNRCPLDSTLVIAFKLPTDSELSVGVCDMDGSIVKMLFTGWISRGNYTMKWNGTDNDGNPVARGIYLGFVDCNGKMDIRPMILDR